MAGLMTGELDIMIHEEQITMMDAQGLTSCPVGLNNYVIVGAKKYIHLSNNFPESLSDINFFTYTSSNPVRAKIDTFFFNHGISVNLFGEADSIEVIKETILRGHCIAALPEWAVKQSLEQNELIIIGAMEGCLGNYHGEANIKWFLLLSRLFGVVPRL